MDNLHERVKVAVIFRPDKTMPVWFEWKGERYKIDNITYRWQEKIGKSLYLHFSVTSQNLLFHLVWHRETMEWFLDGVEG